jgi:ACT domain-containing protein
VLKETNDIKKALKEFIEETGKSRKTFYRYREKINEVMIDV